MHGQGGTRTRDNWIASLTHRPPSHSASTFTALIHILLICVRLWPFYFSQSTDENWKPCIVGTSVQIVHKVRPNSCFNALYYPFYGLVLKSPQLKNYSENGWTGLKN